MNPLDLMPVTATATASAGTAASSRRAAGDEASDFLGMLTELVSHLAEEADGEAAEELAAVEAELADTGDGEATADGLGDAARWLLHAALRVDASGGTAPQSGDGDLEEVVARVVAGERLLTDGEADLEAEAGGEAPADGEMAVDEDAAGLLAGQVVRAAGGPSASTSTAAGAEEPDGDGAERAATPRLGGDRAVARPAGEVAAPMGEHARAVPGDLDSDTEAGDLRLPQAGRDGIRIDPSVGQEAEEADGEALRVELRAGRSASEAAAPPASPLPSSSAEVRDAGTPRPGLAATIERLVEATSRLENLPPPRQLVLELGEMRVRLSLDDAGLRLQLLDEHQVGHRELLRAASEELRARGFDLADGGAEEHAGQGAEPGDDRARSEARGAAGDGRGATSGPADGDAAPAAPVDTAIRM